MKKRDPISDKQVLKEFKNQPMVRILFCYYIKETIYK